MFLVDTNVLSEMQRPKPDPAVRQWMASQGFLVVSAVTIEEIEFGIERAPPERRVRLRGWFDKIAEVAEVLPVDDKIARVAGGLRAARELSGRTVEQADMIIAATALLHGATLVTRNTRDFVGCGVPLLNPFS